MGGKTPKQFLGDWGTPSVILNQLAQCKDLSMQHSLGPEMPEVNLDTLLVPGGPCGAKDWTGSATYPCAWLWHHSLWQQILVFSLTPQFLEGIRSFPLFCNHESESACQALTIPQDLLIVAFNRCGQLSYSVFEKIPGEHLVLENSRFWCPGISEPVLMGWDEMEGTLEK